MAKIYDLMQERAALTAQIRELMNRVEDAELGAEDKTELARMEADFDALNERIAREEKQLERERLAGEAQAAQARKKPEPADEAGRLFARALSGSAAAVQQYRAAAPTLGDEDQAGALTAPMQFVEQLIKGLDDMLFMRQISHITPRLGAGQTLGFPYRATEAADAEWEGEVDAAAEETTLAYGRREFKPNRMAKLIKLSRTLVGHAPMAEGVVRDEMMYRIAITQERHI